MSYFTIKDQAKFQYEEKKSIFIGETIRVDNETEAKNFINKIKQENKDARHHVFAYVIGENFGIQRYSDDGEPQGTGGIPILEVIKKNGLTDIVVVVTRYFGGILLGAGGLTRAYTKAAAESIKSAKRVEKVKGCQLNITLDYELLGKVQHYCEQKEWVIEEINYTDKVELKLYSEYDKLEEKIKVINDLTSAKYSIKISEEGLYFKNEYKLYKL